MFKDIILINSLLLYKKGMANKSNLESVEAQIKVNESKLLEREALNIEAKRIMGEISESSKIEWELRNLESEGKTLAQNHKDKLLRDWYTVEH